MPETEIIFFLKKNKNSKCEILNHLYFSLLANHGGWQFYAAPTPLPPPYPHHKKASYGPDKWNRILYNSEY